jgi:hypothetical protein
MNARSLSLRSALALLCMSGSIIGFSAEENAALDGTAIPLTVPRAECGREDTPETGLQGQVPAALRASGFKGFNCNLKLIGQSRNDGGNWQSAEFRETRRSFRDDESSDSGRRDDRQLRKCGYYGSQSPSWSLSSRDPATYGTRVVDITNESAPQLKGYLQSAAMIDPWESLRVNTRRQLLVADQGMNAGGGPGSGPGVDVYDLSQNCGVPQLLASVAIGTGTDGGTLAPVSPFGHEGAFAPDGLTYYIGDTTNYMYHAVDLTDATHPKHIATFVMGTMNHPFPDVDGQTFYRAHGLSVSDDGNRAYVTVPALGTPAADLGNPKDTGNNGFVILDTSEVQARLPNAKIKFVSQMVFKDGSAAQHTIPITIKDKPYLIHVDEGGSGGLSYAAWVSTCTAGYTPFPMARIVDISNETKPKLASKLLLEVNDPAKCSSVLPDLIGLAAFSYGTHYCSVDDRHNATTLACGMFNSGIRVFDIRDPYRPKEIAYYNPAGVTTPSLASNRQFIEGFKPGQPDWCSAEVHLDAQKGTVWSTCQDNGILIMKFERGVWPFRDSKTPPGEQN